MSKKVRSHAPWTAEEVRSLNGYQACGYAREFTGTAREALIATPEGWISEVGGPVVQTWALKFMADGTWRNYPLYKEG